VVIKQLPVIAPFSLSRNQTVTPAGGEEEEEEEEEGLESGRLPALGDLLTSRRSSFI